MAPNSDYLLAVHSNLAGQKSDAVMEEQQSALPFLQEHKQKPF